MFGNKGYDVILVTIRKQKVDYRIVFFSCNIYSNLYRQALLKSSYVMNIMKEVGRQMIFIKIRKKIKQITIKERNHNLSFPH